MKPYNDLYFVELINGHITFIDETPVSFFDIRTKTEYTLDDIYNSYDDKALYFVKDVTPQLYHIKTPNNHIIKQTEFKKQLNIIFPNGANE